MEPGGDHRHSINADIRIVCLPHLQLISASSKFSCTESQSVAAGKGLGWIFEDFNKMKLVKAFSNRLPSDILKELRKFKILNSVELATTVTMLLTAAFAYLVCN